MPSVQKWRFNKEVRMCTKHRAESDSETNSVVRVKPFWSCCLKLCTHRHHECGLHRSGPAGSRSGPRLRSRRWAGNHSASRVCMYSIVFRSPCCGNVCWLQSGTKATFRHSPSLKAWLPPTESQPVPQTQTSPLYRACGWVDNKGRIIFMPVSSMVPFNSG